MCTAQQLATQTLSMTHAVSIGCSHSIQVGVGQLQSGTLHQRYGNIRLLRDQYQYVITLTTREWLTLELALMQAAAALQIVKLICLQS
jgi:hypothetical protein